MKMDTGKKFLISEEQTEILQEAQKENSSMDTSKAC